MADEQDGWLSRALKEGDPSALRSADALLDRIGELGFLPLFAGEARGCSVEEMTSARGWWTGDPDRDPWLWREILSASGKVAYGKFFAGRAGFIALEWMPFFVNYRRDGYDFDALWDDGKAGWRQKKIMDLFETGEERFSFEVRRDAGFGKGGEKNFEATVGSLQHDLYLVVRDFRQRRNRHGAPYGWPIAVYATPESVWGYDEIHAAFGETPGECGEKILNQARKAFPQAEAGALVRLLR